MKLLGYMAKAMPLLQLTDLFVTSVVNNVRNGPFHRLGKLLLDLLGDD